MKTRFTLLFLLSICVSGCGWLWNDLPDEQPCNPQTINTGEILWTIEDICPAQQEYENGIVIRDDSTYRAVLPQDSLYNCGPLPNVDFNAYSVLVLSKGGGGCSVGFIRNVNRDDANKSIYYSVEVTACGMCLMYGFSHNAVVVERIPEDYQVEFN